MNKPEKLQLFVSVLMKEACRSGLLELFREAWEMSEEEVYECIDYMEEKLEVSLL